MQKYVHIGMPKCASTSLQNSFFSNHPEICHLGSGFDGITGRYIDRDVARLAESDLRFKKDYLWRPEPAREVFNRHFRSAGERPECRAVGLSSEFLGFTLGNEIDVASKARRLQQVFGEDSQMIIIIRNQMSLLQSLYMEMIKGGYPGSYRNFLEYTLLFQDRNWCHDFCYDHTVGLYEQLFGRDRVHVMALEQLSLDSPGFAQRLCDALGLENPGIELGWKNAATDLRELELLRRFNEKWPHEFGSAFFQPFQTSRLQAYFEDELGVKVPLERNIDDFMRGPLGEIAREKLGVGNIPELELEAPDVIGSRLLELYGKSNARLAGRLDFDLPGLGYTVA
ncbi:MAG TPA: hypothetical protein VKN35_03905 [Xanthomonadales bacterium]|nr:hypothetical protein [Xanthomonadales bacterium]